MEIHMGGWKFTASQFKNAGLDIEEVYNFIFKMVQQQKMKLDALTNLEPNIIPGSDTVK
jgi:hypothetical protein